jgi:menaquinone-dependent protoporphyrinogen IX oxidase
MERLLIRDTRLNTHILAAYATKHGATKEIAEKVGQVLREMGLQADVLPADPDFDRATLASYEAVVLGRRILCHQPGARIDG